MINPYHVIYLSLGGIAFGLFFIAVDYMAEWGASRRVHRRPNGRHPARAR